MTAPKPELMPCRFEGDFCAEHMSRERLVRADTCEEVYWNKRHLWENRRAVSPVEQAKEAVVAGEYRIEYIDADTVRLTPIRAAQEAA